MNVTVIPHKLAGAITPPPSKSQAHRALIAAALAGGESRIENLADSQDIQATRRCMAALAEPGEGRPVLDCGESGSTLRFLIPVALALREGGKFTGGGRLLERPLTPYNSAFEKQGIFMGFREKPPKILDVEGILKPGIFAFPGDVSSQFITGMLFALPLLDGHSELMLTSDLESGGYVDMTLDVLKQFGIQIEHRDARRFHIPGGQRYQSRDMIIESDYSQAAFYYAANGLGSGVEIRGLNASSVQGDMRIVPYYRQLCAPGPVELDVSQCPDLVPPLAVHAALRAGQTTAIVGAARLRIKESDRLDTVTTELCKLGADVRQTPDSLLIRGVETLSGGDTEAHNDHRIAMMLAVAATRAAGPVTIRGAECVAKSYPNFWEDYQSLGGVFT